MQFIEPIARIIEQPSGTDPIEILRHIERIGRTCYKSEEKITDDSAGKFIKMLRDRKHWAMLEHYQFVIECRSKVQGWEYYSEFFLKYLKDPNPVLIDRMRYIHVSQLDKSESETQTLIIAGSATAFNYLIQVMENTLLRESTIPETYLLAYIIFNFLREFVPELFIDTPLLDDYYNHSSARCIYEFEADHNIRIVPYADIKKMNMKYRQIFETASVRFVVDRGVSHELVRHRPASWAQESTRYCNYSKRGMAFIVPCWISTHDKGILMDHEKLNNIVEDPYFQATNEYDLEYKTLDYLDAIIQCSKGYDYLTTADSASSNDIAWFPQQARCVLPNSLKTEIVMTANLFEFDHFFKMRDDAAAHPQMREVVSPLHQAFIDAGMDIHAEESE